MNFLKSFFKRPQLIIAVCVLASIASAIFLFTLNMDNSLRQFFPQKDVAYSRLVNAEETFGSMLSIGLTLETNDETILTAKNIAIISRITDRILELSDVENVDSLTHIDYVCADSDGTILASKLLPKNFCGRDEEIEILKERLFDWHEMYNRVIVNEDLRGTQMLITLVPKGEAQIAFDAAKNIFLESKENFYQDKSEENRETLQEAKTNFLKAKKDLKKSQSDSRRQQNVLKQIRQIAQEEISESTLKLILVGEPVLSENSKKFMVSDLTHLIPLVVVVVLISLYASFKTIDGTLLPLVTVLMATAISCGLMGIFGVTFTLVSSVIPVALIAVGSAYGIHVLTHYYIAVSEVEGEMTREKYEAAIFSGMKEVWLAVLLAGITTVVGFLSLVSSPIGPLHSFSIFTSLGVTLSLLLSVTFIPAFLLCKDYKKLNKKSKATEKFLKKAARIKSRLERLTALRGGKTKSEAEGETLYNVFRFFCGSPARLTVTSVFIVVFSIIGVRLLKIDTALINYFPRSAQFRKDIDYVDEQFAGTNGIYFTIEGQQKGDITNPELLKAVDDLEKHLLQHDKEIGKIVSLSSFVKRINQIWFDPASPAQNFENENFSGTNFSDDFFSDDFENFSFDDFGDFDDFAKNAFSDTSKNSEAKKNPAENFEVSQNEIEKKAWIDPNIAFREKLNSPMNTRDVIKLIDKAYFAAGGKSATIDAIVDELMKEFNYKGKVYYEIPYDPEKYPQATREDLKSVIDNYLILLSGSLGRFLDDEMNPSSMRIMCQLRNHSTATSQKIIDEAKKFAAQKFPAGYTIEATGSGEMEVSMTSMIVKSQFLSLVFSLVSVFIILWISFGSPLAGLLGVVPLTFSILLNYMVMGFAGIKLDLITSIIASVAVGVGIDYTIHFLTTYREERSKTNDIVEVTKRTFRKSGHGILTNALAVGLGFSVLCLSKFLVLRCIGILAAVVMSTSSFLAMTIIPGILNIADPKFIRPKNEANEEIKLLQ